MGGVPDFPYKEESHEFVKGDTLFMFTDGLNESINSKKEEFSYERIENILKENKDSSSDVIIEKMNEALDEFVGKEDQFDDVTMIVAKYQDNELHLSYDKKDYSIITDIIDNFESHFSYLPKECLAQGGIVIDEAVNNLVSYEKREDLKIDVDFKVSSGALEIKITSNGDDYNPFENHKEKYLDKFHPQIKEGGFGLSLIKDFASKYGYEYKNKHSILTVEIAIKK